MRRSTTGPIFADVPVSGVLSGQPRRPGRGGLDARDNQIGVALDRATRQ